MRRLIGSLGIIIGASSAAIAAGDVRSACSSDFKTLCGDVQPGGGRIMQCMAAHREQISQACKMAVVDRMMERRASRTASRSADAGAK